MARELLVERLRAWLRMSFFNTLTLADTKALVGELSGKRPWEKRADAELPAALTRSHCLKYEALSPQNRRAVLQAALDFMGLDDATAHQVLGRHHWAEINARIDAICAEPQAIAPPAPAPILAPAGDVQAAAAHELSAVWSQSRQIPWHPAAGSDESLLWDAPDTSVADESAAPAPPSAWAQGTLAERVAALPAAAFFWLSDLNAVADALDYARQACGLPAHDMALHPDYAGLMAINGCALDPKLSEPVPPAARQGLRRRCRPCSGWTTPRARCCWARRATRWCW